MATAVPPAPPATPSPHGIKGGVQPLRAGEGHSFFWRKLHSLTGIVPIGAFLIEHIVSNFETVNGPLAYAKQVLFLNSLPARPCPRVGLHLHPSRLPRHLQASSSPSAAATTSTSTPGPATWMYLSQRVTGIIAFLYIIQHVWRQRFSGVSLPEHPGAAFAKVQHELANPWMLAIYVIAMIATCWHFSYGVWLFAAEVGASPPATKPARNSRLGLRTRRRSPLPHGPHQHLRRRHRTTRARRTSCPSSPPQSATMSAPEMTNLSTATLRKRAMISGQGHLVIRAHGFTRTQ